MKRNHLFLLLAGLFSAGTVVADKYNPYQLSVISSQAQKTGNTLHIEFALDYSHLTVPANDQLLVQPVVVSSTDTLRLPFLLFPGKTREKVNQRKIRLYGPDGTLFPDPYATLYPTENGKAIFTYHQTIPFADWMYGARLELQQDIYGCADCHRILASLPLSYIASPPTVAFIIPLPDTNRQERATLYVSFPWDQATIYPNFRNNAVELDKINRSMQRIVNERPSQVRRVSLTGYASPEGSYPYNTRLAGRRLQAVKNYIQRYYPVEEALFITSTVPEDWDGVRRWTDSSNLRHRDQVVDIITQTADPDARDHRIRRLDNGATYRRLLREAYPPLRRVEYQVNYSVAPLSTAHCREIYRTNPEKLTPYELYQVAQSYPDGSPEFNEVILITARLYPRDAVANNNAAAIALRQEDLPKARTYLLQAQQSPQAMNNQGVLLLLEGNYPEAYRCFREAGDCGCREAILNQHNMERAQLK